MHHKNIPLHAQVNGIHACLYDEIGLSSPLHFLKRKLKIKEDKTKTSAARACHSNM